MEEMKEEMKKKNEAMDMMINMLAEVTGDTRFVIMKKETEFHRKIQNIITDENVTDEKLKQINDLLYQFTKLVDDVLDGENEI